MKLTISRATTKDRNELLELSGHFENDYLEHVLDSWINQEAGGLYLVRCGETVAACCCLSFPSPAEGWLQGMRVHPRYREQGIARRLTADLIRQAQLEGAGIIRLLTSPDNEPARRVAAREGFSVCGPIREIVYLEPLQDRGQIVGTDPDWVQCRLVELDTTMDFIDRSPLSPTEELVFCSGYMYRNLTQAYLRDLIAMGAVYYLPGERGWRGLLIMQKDTARSNLVCRYINVEREAYPAVCPSAFLTHSGDCRHFSISMTREQHRLLRPHLELLLGRYETETWYVLERTERNQR